jgi:flagellar basal body rod protein FlgG
VNIGLYSGVNAARASERRLEGIAANLANVDTPAFKRVATGVEAVRMQGGGELDLGLRATALTDFSQGPLEPSSSPYHLALMGPGFFAVEGPRGELYTRNGSFHVDDSGVLQTNEGYPVAWERRGNPIDSTGEVVTVDGRGVVRQGQLEVGKLKVTDFTDRAALQDLGDGYFQASAGNREVAAEGVVHQHNLEGSNVSSIDELVAMIAVQRGFESARNVMSLIDQSYGRLTQSR